MISACGFNLFSMLLPAKENKQKPGKLKNSNLGLHSSHCHMLDAIWQQYYPVRLRCTVTYLKPPLQYNQAILCWINYAATCKEKQTKTNKQKHTKKGKLKNNFAVQVWSSVRHAITLCTIHYKNLESDLSTLRSSMVKQKVITDIMRRETGVYFQVYFDHISFGNWCNCMFFCFVSCTLKHDFCDKNWYVWSVNNSILQTWQTTKATWHNCFLNES